MSRQSLSILSPYVPSICPVVFRSSSTASPRGSTHRASTYLHLVIEGNSRLDSALILHCLQTLLPLIEFKRLVDNAGDLHLTGIEVVDCRGELVGLGERAQNGDFVADLYRTQN
jgi:hypothetical protein